MGCNETAFMCLTAKPNLKLTNQTATLYNLEWWAIGPNSTNSAPGPLTLDHWWSLIEAACLRLHTGDGSDTLNKIIHLGFRFHLPYLAERSVSSSTDSDIEISFRLPPKCTYDNLAA